MVFKIGVLKNFAIIIGKHLMLESLLKKFAGLKTCNFVKKGLHEEFVDCN